MPGRYARILFAVALTGLLSSFAAVPEAGARDRTLKFHFPHTGERGTFTYKRNGKYDRGELKKINRFLRDWRQNAVTEIDPKLLDLVWEVYRLSGARDAPITVISAYRSPKTNEKLRKRSRGVAKNSQHTHGRAMDFHIPGVPLSKLREIGLKMQAGGVGFYPASGSPFVHLDTGSVRHWPRMTRKQLMAVFPTGETVHVPTDGKPLPGYNLAKVKVDKNRKNGAVVAYLDRETRAIVPTRPKAAPSSRDDTVRATAASLPAKGGEPGTRKWLSRVFGGDEEEDEIEGELIATEPGEPMDLVDDPAVQIAEIPLPRGRPDPAATETAAVAVASLEGLPRPRPDSTPFDITPQEREQIAELALSPPVGGRAGSRRTDDALAGLYATASYDPGEDAVRRAREQLARAAAAEARAREEAPAEAPSAEVDDALAGLFATADGDGPAAMPADRAEPQIALADRVEPQSAPPEIQPATVVRAQKGDMIETAALVPPRHGSALARARQGGQSIFRARDDESPLARASRERALVETEPRSALAAANSFGRPAATRSDRERARQSLIRLAYADGGRTDAAAEPQATGSVLAEARPRAVPSVAPLEPAPPLVATGFASDGPLAPLPRARPGSEAEPPVIVASLPRDAVARPLAAPRRIREVPIVEPAVPSVPSGDGGGHFRSPAPDDADRLAAAIERETGADDPWPEDSRRVADIAERMMAGGTQVQARDFAELRRPDASNMQSMFAPLAEGPAAEDEDGGWQTATAALAGFRPIPRPDAFAPRPRTRPAGRRIAAAQDREAPGALARWIRSARSLLQ